MANKRTPLCKKARKQLRERVKNRKNTGTFTLLPHDVMDCQAFLSLSNKAVKCLLDIYRAYNGRNNGDLSCTIGIMKERGWKSKSQLDNARDELLMKGLIVKTRQGGRNKCSLYAVTWLPIHECSGKLDRKPTRIALGYWKQCCNPELPEAILN